MLGAVCLINYFTAGKAKFEDPVALAEAFPIAGARNRCRRCDDRAPTAFRP